MQLDVRSRKPLTTREVSHSAIMGLNITNKEVKQLWTTKKVAVSS